MPIPLRPSAAALAVALLLAAAAGLDARRQPAGPPPPPAALPAPVDRGAPLPGALSPRNANYTIEARLDAQTRTIEGRAEVAWRNISAAPTSELQWHLYWNAWRNSASTWLRGRALGGSARALLERPEADWAAIDITAIRLLGDGPPVDLLPSLRFLAPDDGNEHDRTLASVSLPSAVAPGETINIVIQWRARVPRTFARTGTIGRYFFLAQWFPKVAVLHDGGWRAHQFHSGTEFFSNFGAYDVSLRVPAGWVVGATGREQSREDNDDGTTTHRYVQHDVHDFAWTTSPDYLERTARFEHPTLPAVEMRLLLQPEHARQADRHFDATRAALRYYGEWFGPYPYGHITIVDPAWQSGAGGMEYPTLFTSGTRWLAPRGVTQPEGVTIHEAGHQFWYGIVANDEFEHAWLDEGLNTFSTARVIGEVYQPNHHAERFFGGFIPWVYRDIALSRAVDGNRVAGYRASATIDAQSTPSWQYYPGAGGALSYNKTALWLHTLERLLGWDTLQRILSTFFERFQFRHPTPDDFFRVANEVSGQDLTWFFDQVHRSSSTFDYGIADLTTGPAGIRGWVDGAAGREFRDGSSTEGRYETRVIVRRYGDAIFPVDVVVRFDDGEIVQERWDGRDRWQAYTFVRDARAVSAEVDPDRVLLLDLNVTNNSRTLAPRQREAATKWAAIWLVWLQDLLMTYGMFI